MPKYFLLLGGITAPVLAAIPTQLIASGAAIDVTPTLVAGANVTYSIANPPTGYSFNTSTGQLTGTLSTAGKWDVEITATNGAGSDTAYFAVSVYTTTANISSADTFPYICDAANRKYTLTTDVTTPGIAFYIADRDIILDLNGHTIHHGGSSAANTWGVVLYLSYINTEISIPGAAEPLNPVIINGTIVNDGAGDLSHGIYGHRGENSVIDNMRIETDGKDSATVFFQYLDTTIQNSVLIDHTSSTFNRHAGPANVQVPNGKVVAENNLLIGGNSGFNVGSDSVIRKNVIGHNSFATNGYGVWLYRKDNVTITDNLILPTNGRGILFNAGNNSTATGNVILSLEPPNAEFGSALNAPAVRARYETAGIVYSNNTSLGIGGAAYTSASGLYISSYGVGVSRYENNDAAVILAGTPDINHYVQPVTLEGTSQAGAPGLDVIANNRFKSNYLLVRVEGYDGFTQQLQPLARNSFDWIDGSTASQSFVATIATKIGTLSLSGDVLTSAQSYIANISALVPASISDAGLLAERAVFQTKYITHTGQTYLDVLDSTWGAGVDPKSYTYNFSNLSQGAVKVREGFTSQLKIVNNSVPVANTAVDVLSDQGDTDTVTTDSSGFGLFTFWNFAIEKAEPVNEPFVLTHRLATTLSVGADSGVVTHSSVPATLDIGI